MPTANRNPDILKIEPPSQTCQSGVALIITMIALLVMSIGGISVMSLSVFESKKSRSSLAQNHAFFAAEVGLKQAIQKVIEGEIDITSGSSDCGSEVVSGSISSISTVPNSQPRYTVHLNCTASDRYFKSAGTAMDGSTSDVPALREIEVNIAMSSEPGGKASAALTVLGGLDVSGKKASEMGTSANSGIFGRDSGYSLQGVTIDDVLSMAKNLNNTTQINDFAAQLMEGFNCSLSVPDCLNELRTALVDSEIILDSPVKNPTTDADLTASELTSFVSSVAGVATAISGNIGSNLPTGVYYSSRDLTFTGSTSGSGLLIVDGTLEMSGTPSWDGIILVSEGDFYLDGGGTGGVTGAVIVADIDRDDGNYEFKNVLVNVSGGGSDGTIVHDCDKIDTALQALSDLGIDRSAWPLPTCAAQATGGSTSLQIRDWREILK